MISKLLNKNKYRVRLNVTLINIPIIIAYLGDKCLIKTLKPFEYNSFRYILFSSIFSSINCSIATRPNLFEFVKVAVLHVLNIIVISYKAIQYCMYVVVEHQIIFPSRCLLSDSNYPNIIR